MMPSPILLIYCYSVMILSQGSFAHLVPDHEEHQEHEHFHSHGLRWTQQASSFSDANGTPSTDTNEYLQIRSPGGRCGAQEPSEAQMTESARIVAKWRSDMKSGLLQDVSTIDVPTYFHVITDGTTGAISDTKLQEQLEVLNDSYQPYGFSFSLQETTRTDNDDWYYAGAFTADDEAMKTALRKGGASSLNVYFKDSEYLGYSTFPDDFSTYPELDGVVVLGTTIPGGATTRYDEGKTLVHETGHWLGLYHTFQQGNSLFSFLPFFSIFFGCWTEGDLIADTPVEKTETYGCPTRKDTCWLRLGVDPIHNYMDYSDDVCYTEFTADQAERMWAMWNEYRA